MKRRTTFWLAFAALQLLVAAAVVGGLELLLRRRVARLPPAAVPSGVAVPSYYNNPGVVVPKDPYDLTVRHSINSRGFRGPELSERRPRLLLLGDSVMAGVIVRDDQTLPALLQEALPSWDVVNGGVSGYDLWDYEGFFKERGAALRPDYLIIGIYVNDNTRVAGAGAAAGAPQPPALRGSVLVKTLMYAAASRFNKRSPFALPKPVTRADRAELRRLVDEPSAAALEAFLRDYKYAAGPMLFEWLPRMLDLAAWREAGEPLKRLAAEARRRKLKVAAVVFPAQFEVYPGYAHPEPHRTIGRLLEEAKVPYVDLTEAFRREGGDELFPYRSDTSHPGPKGYEVARRETLTLMRRLGWLPSP